MSMACDVCGQEITRDQRLRGFTSVVRGQPVEGEPGAITEPEYADVCSKPCADAFRGRPAP